MQILDLRGADKVRFDPDEVENAVDIPKPVGLILGHGETDSPTTMPPRVKTGLLLKSSVELNAIGVHLGHVETADEVRDQTGGMPGGTGGEFVFINQNGVGPTLVGQVIEQTNAHSPTTDYHATRLILHQASAHKRFEHVVPVVGTSYSATHPDCNRPIDTPSATQIANLR